MGFPSWGSLHDEHGLNRGRISFPATPLGQTLLRFQAWRGTAFGNHLDPDPTELPVLGAPVEANPAQTGFSEEVITKIFQHGGKDFFRQAVSRDGLDVFRGRLPLLRKTRAAGVCLC